MPVSEFTANPAAGASPRPTCTRLISCVGAIHESPAVSAPSERGLSNAQHLTGGRDFFISLPPSFACGKSHPLTAAVSLCRFATSPSHCEGVDPNKWGGLRNGQDRSLRVVGAIHESPACHYEPLGEESRLVYFYFALLEILRYRAG